MFKTGKPSAQPRTLRTIAEKKNRGEGFMDEAHLDTQAGIPMSAPGAGQRYSQAAEMEAHPKSGAVRAPHPADPKPFK